MIKVASPPEERSRMKKSLFPAGLTLGLHLLLGLALSELPQEKIVPRQRQQPFTVVRFYDKVPAEIRTETKDPVSTPLQRPGRPPKMPSAKSSDNLLAPPREEGGRIKLRVETSLPTTISPQQPVTTPAYDHPPERSAVQENRTAATSTAGSSNVDLVSWENGPITSRGSAPVRPALESQPVYKETPKPQYPALARQLGYQGTVEMKILVNRNGTVSELQIVKSSGYPTLDHSAMVTVQRWRFKPGTRNGTEEDMWIKVPLSFKLR